MSTPEFQFESNGRAWISRIREVLAVVLLTFRPINPNRWPPVARRLSSGPGWMAPMVMFAALGIMVSVRFGRFGNVPFLQQFGLATWVTWFLVGSIATWMVATRARRNIFRFGLWCLTFPRWWFEVARLLFILAVFSALTLLISVWLGPANGILIPVAIEVLYPAAKWSAIGFLLIGSVGYALSFVRRMPRRGKAFELLHFFYTNFVGLALMTIAVTMWPLRAIWPDGMIAAIVALLGLAIFACGFITNIIRYENWERRRMQSST